MKIKSNALPRARAERRDLDGAALPAVSTSLLLLLLLLLLLSPLPLIYHLPCEAVSRGRQGPQGSRQGCRLLFVRTGVLSKSPAAAHGLAGRSPASAEEGGLLFGDFLLAIQEKVTRAPQAHETLLLQRKSRVRSSTTSK